jgi:hypothetical protein
VPAAPPPTALALPDRLRLGDHDIHPEQILNIPGRRPDRDGPWRDEPDRIAWIDPVTGYSCLILRQLLGNLSGFVAVPPSHPLWGFERDAIPVELAITAHRGLDHSAPCDQTAPPTVRICHVDHVLQRDQRVGSRDKGPSDADGEAAGTPDAWWFGFNCDKPCDLLPKSTVHNAQDREDGPRIYRDLPYVAGEVMRLAAQLKALEHPSPNIHGEDLASGVPLNLEVQRPALLPRKGGAHD